MRKKKLIYLLDHAIWLNILCLGAVPFAKVPIGNAWALNLEAYGYISLITMLIPRLLISRRNRDVLPFVLFSFIAGMGFFVGVLAGDSPIPKALDHLRTYTPFILACLLLWSGTTVPSRRILYGYTVALSIGAVLAVYLFFLNPTAVLRAYGDTPEASAMLDWGRLPFQQAHLTLMALLPCILFRPQKRRYRFILPLLGLVGLTAAIATFSRTLIAGLIILFIFILIYSIRNKQWSNLRRMRNIVGGLVLASIVLVPLDSRVSTLFHYRILGDKSSASGNFYGPKDVAARTSLYEEYLPRLENHWLFGQGLGVDYTGTKNTCWADVSLVSFALPFGLFGIGCFLYFLVTLHRRITMALFDEQRAIAWSLGATIFVGLLISLNDDIWSHKSFVIFLTYVVSSLPRRPGDTNPVIL